MRIQRILFMSVHVWVSLHPKKRIIRSILYYLKRYQESEESDEKWLVAVHWQVENYLFLIIWKTLWDRLFTVPDFSVRSSKSSVLPYRWMSVKNTNGTREGLGRSEKNRRLFKHYCALSSRSGGALGILRFLSLKFKRSYYGSW